MEIEDYYRCELEKKREFMKWLRRMSNIHWQWSTKRNSKNEKYYHRAKAQAYEIVLNAFQNESLRDEYEKSAEESVI